MLSLCIACNNIPNSQVKQVQIKNKVIKNLRFSLKNETKIPIKEIKVKLPDTTLFFFTLDSLSRTQWIKVKSAYSYSPIEFKDYKDINYVLQIIDYSGEKLYDSGCMTYVFQTRTNEWKHTHNSNYIYDGTRWGYSLDCNEETQK